MVTLTLQETQVLANGGSITLVGTAGPVTPPQPSGAGDVYRSGLKWAGDWSFDMSISYIDTTLQPPVGQFDIKCTLTGPWGGWLPYYKAGGTFVLTPYTHIHMTLKALDANPSISVYFVGANDQPIPGANPVFVDKYSPLVIGQWVSYSLPLKDFGIAANQAILKFGVQDQTGSSTGGFGVAEVYFS